MKPALILAVIITVAIPLQADTVTDDGTVHVKTFNLPPSALMNDVSISSILQQKKIAKKDSLAYQKCSPLLESELSEVPEIRKCLAHAYYSSQGYKDLRKKYNVIIKPKIIGDVYTEIFTPKDGIADKNRDRVLINVHGGSFIGGSRTAGQMESIPISAIGKIKVVSIDYRMAPEHRFPAASEDVEVVYRELLKSYKPENIGLYGYSAGGTLTSQAIAWFLKEELPLPAAIGMIAGAASTWRGGDAMHIGGAIIGVDVLTEEPGLYFEGADMSDPLAVPAKSDVILSKFPPSLLITATRDFALSNVIHTHRQLVRLGVEADLHVWEGMGHELIAAYYTEEAREAYNVLVDFFDEHLDTDQ